MDFFNIVMTEVDRGPDKGKFVIIPDFIVGRSTDLMIRGKSFYAIWDETAGLWSTDEYDVQRIVDEELRKFVQRAESAEVSTKVKWMRNSSSGSWKAFRNFMSLLSDNSHELDGNLTFANTEVKKSDYVSRRLPYSIGPGDYSAWDELVGTLYSVEERAKLEWAIGAIVSGDSKTIQKFLVLYGPAGTGKSTILNIIAKLFEGYVTSFEASALGSSSAAFAMEAFSGNPLVAIQHDGDLSKIADNTKLNSVVAHEEMRFNEKYKPGYDAAVRAFLLMGTNQPVKITDAKSGLIRRLIDVHPTGVSIPTDHYHTLLTKIQFEYGAIAQHCLDVYRKMGKNYYSNYRPLEMMLQTDVFFNFIEYGFDTFKEQDGTTLTQAYAMYKQYCADTGIERTLPQYKVREELRNYFEEFKDRGHFMGAAVRSLYSGFTTHRFKIPSKEGPGYSLAMDQETSILDEMLGDELAQYQVWDEALEAYRPKNKWTNVKTKLKDIDAHEVHYVRVPEQHIVIDFDLRDADGNKSLERNLEAASGWPSTYGEISQGGNGVHLHYLFDGDVHGLAQHFSDGIEVKTLLDGAALRRRLSRCNNVPVASISTGLPLKEKAVLGQDTMKDETSLRRLIQRALNKEIHPGTKSSVDFIEKICNDAFDGGMVYDVSDLKPKIIAFANQATNQSILALKTVMRIKWKSEDVEAEKALDSGDEPIVFFDVEVYPNLFVVCWKAIGDASVVKMVNPSPSEIEELCKRKLVGFYNRRYDNHILYARLQGYTNERLYEFSQKLVVEHNNAAMFGSAYNLSYADIWDFSSKKQSLKKFQVELGLSHMEMDIPWDQPVPQDLIPKVVDYCANDVITTEQVFKDREQDFVARQILAELSGLSVNDTTQKHTAKIIFEGDKHPQASFNYPNLPEEFPGYAYDAGKSTYRDEDPSEGGYVHAEPGIYEDVRVWDIASMHPTTIKVLNLFGEYTKNFNDLLEARLAIKNKDFATARKLLAGKLAPYLTNESAADELSYALKIVINIVYGLTAAKFDNPFRDLRNRENVVAKRGALFMIDLKHFVQERGFQVVHIKTDSIKVPGATDELWAEVQEFGLKYGYTFEHEATYDRFCLVNDAVYIAHIGWAAKERKIGTWEAVGAQFQHPFVYKTLFSGEPVTFEDHLEQKQVTQGVMYLDYEHQKPEPMVERMQYIGKNGLFMPVQDAAGGGVLYREKDGKLYAVTGTKGFLWLPAEIAIDLHPKYTDVSYFEKLVAKAIAAVETYGEFDTFKGVENATQH